MKCLRNHSSILLKAYLPLHIKKLITKFLFPLKKTRHSPKAMSPCYFLKRDLSIHKWFAYEMGNVDF